MEILLAMNQRRTARVSAVSRVFVAVCVGVALHALLRPVFSSIVADNVPMIAAIAIVLFNDERGDEPVRRPEWWLRAAAAVGIAALATALYRVLNNLPAIYAAIVHHSSP